MINCFHEFICTGLMLPVKAQGWILLIGTQTCFVWCLYGVLVSKVMPETGQPVLDWMRRDRYYTFLAPLLLPVAILAVYLNWVGLKLFRHN